MKKLITFWKDVIKEDYQIILVFGKNQSLLHEHLATIRQSKQDLDKANSWIIYEFPLHESHPTHQASFMDMIIKQGRMIHIVFTHSETMLTRLQTRVAEGKITKEQIALINIVDKGLIDILTLNDAGDIENWPDNFFGNILEESATRVLNFLAKQKFNNSIK